MRNRRHYYRILHVQPDAPVEIIRSSYRALMLTLEMHPDRGGEHWNAALINEAYEVLSDPERRKQYDLQLAGAYSVQELSGRPGDEAVPGTRGKAPPEDPIGAAGSYCVFCQTPHAGNPLLTPDRLCAGCGSPLCPLLRSEQHGSDQRATARVARDQEIRIFVDWPQAKADRGQIRDLSPHGMRFLTNRALQQYQIVKIDGELLQATARVAHTSAGRGAAPFAHAVGVEFYTLLLRSQRGTFLSRKG